MKCYIGVRETMHLFKVVCECKIIQQKGDRYFVKPKKFLSFFRKGEWITRTGKKRRLFVVEDEI